MIKVIFAGLTMIGLTYALSRMSVGLFLPNIAESLDLSNTEVGLIGSIGYFSYALSLLFTPLLVSKIGSFFSILFAGVSAVVGMIGIALAFSFIFLAAFVFLAGIGGGIASASVTKIAKNTIPQKGLNQANALMNSGASFGFIFVAPLVLFMSQLWRLNYWLFALVGCLIVGISYLFLPQESTTVVVPTNKVLKIDHLKRQLLIASLLFGFVTAIYWTFSRLLLIDYYELNETYSMVLWLLMAISGIIGGLSGTIVNKIGLPFTFHFLFILMGLSMALLLFSSPFSLFLSAIVFGSTYLLLTGVLIIWATASFVESPEAGVSFSFFLLGIGQAFGAFIAGLMIESWSYPTTFLIFSFLCFLSLFLRTGANQLK